MSDIAIQVENLSKLYHIGKQAKYKTARESLTNTITAPARWLKNLGQPKVHDAATDLWALKDVSFEVKRGEVVGIIGRNGAGKSTLLKVLSRITEPTSGRIKIHGRVGSLLEVGTGFHPELTGRENIFLNGAILGMRRAEIAAKFDEIVAFSEIERFIDTPVKHYSSGMYMRLAFAVAAHLEPEILIVDEVLAVGDAAFQKKCMGKMKDVAGKGRTVLFVSHNMAAIESLCTAGVVLERGRVRLTENMQSAIRLYLGGTQGQHVTFEKGPLKSVSISQVQGHLELIADYESNTLLTLPCLGFVISDYLGNPICGSNPRKLAEDQFPPASRSGSVKTVIRQPQLLNGSYRLSVWFGDGRTDFVEAKDCLFFDVVNMSGIEHQPAQAVGPVMTVCDWTFDQRLTLAAGSSAQLVATPNLAG